MKFTKENLYANIPVHRLLNEMDEFLNFGVNCEIYLSSEFIDENPIENLQSIKSKFKEAGLSIRVHGPFVDLNPGSSDNRIRQVSLERFLKTVELSVVLGAKSITLHTHFEPVFYEKYFNQWLENSNKIWSALSFASEEKEIAIHIENSIDNNASAVLAILQAHPSFGACFDVAHYNVFNSQGWEAALKEYPIGSIKEVHLSDNNGDEDSHLAFGEGSIDFIVFFNKITQRNEEPIFTIEPHSQEGLRKDMDFIAKL